MRRVRGSSSHRTSFRNSFRKLVGFGCGFWGWFGGFCKITLELMLWLHVFRSSSQTEELQQLKTQSKFWRLQNIRLCPGWSPLGIPFPMGRNLQLLLPVQGHSVLTGLCKLWEICLLPWPPFARSKEVLLPPSRWSQCPRTRCPPWGHKENWSQLLGPSSEQCPPWSSAGPAQG